MLNVCVHGGFFIRRGSDGLVCDRGQVPNQRCSSGFFLVRHLNAVITFKSCLPSQDFSPSLNSSLFFRCSDGIWAVVCAGNNFRSDVRSVQLVETTATTTTTSTSTKSTSSSSSSSNYSSSSTSSTR